MESKVDDDFPLLFLNLTSNRKLVSNTRLLLSEVKDYTILKLPEF